MRMLDEALLEDVVVGSTVLGSGGGGDPYIGKLLARDAIRRFGPVPLYSLDELAPDARIASIAAFGAPGVLVEKLPRPADAVMALEALEAHLGYSFSHLVPIEAGGLNSVMPVPVAAQRGLPMVDADGMGRAWPTIDLVTPALYGARATPLALADEHANIFVLESRSSEWAEKICRAATVASGCITLLALYPMSGQEAKKWLVDAPLARAAHLGHLVRTTRPRAAIAGRIVADGGGVLLFEGNVTRVDRRTERGWTMGTATVSGTGGDSGRSLQLLFQNEYLVALRDNGDPPVSTPDLIMTLGLETGEPIPAEEIRYGFRVAVIGLPCDGRWRTEEGLRRSGPQRFGYDFDYVPVEETGAASARVGSPLSAGTP